MSASAKAISGFLPPNSSVTSFTAVSAAAFWIAMPDAGCPIKAMRFTRGWRTSVSPVSRPPVTMLTTPGGMICLQISARIEEDSGLCSDGFTTIALPEMIAGAMREAAKPIG